MKVSIITPTYNHERLIGQCIESVLAQTESDWEQIVVDDCSSDATAKLVKGYRDPRIRLLSTTTRNGIEHLDRSYNQALALAKGELIAVLEGDDYWPPDKLERQCPAFNGNGVVLTWGRTARDLNGKIQEEPDCATTFHRLSFPRSAEWLLQGNPIGAVTAMIRKGALDDIGGFCQLPGTVMLDYSTWLRLSPCGEFHYVPALLGYWRVHAGQTTQVKRKEMFASTIKILQDVAQDSRKSSHLSPAVLAYCKARTTLFQAQIEHANCRFFRAAGHYMQALRNIRGEDRIAAIRLLIRSILCRPL